MWKFLYQLGSPKYFFEQSVSWIRWSGILWGLMLPVALIWGLFIAPQDYQQGDAFRIIYIHVPAAFLSMGLYAFLSFLSLLLLVWRIKMAGLLLKRVAELGASMALLALLTGSIWGKPMWGAYWVWDARLTSELILLFLYVAIIAVSGLSRRQESSERLMAILALVGVVDLPIIHYSVYWWNTLHQGATLTILSKPKIAPAMLYPLLLSLLSLMFFSAWILLSRLQNDLLIRFRDQQWVRKWSESL